MKLKNYNIIPNRNFLVLCNFQNTFKTKPCIATHIQKNTVCSKKK